MHRFHLNFQLNCTSILCKMNKKKPYLEVKTYHERDDPQNCIHYDVLSWWIYAALLLCFFFLIILSGFFFLLLLFSLAKFQLMLKVASDWIAQLIHFGANTKIICVFFELLLLISQIPWKIIIDWWILA